MSDLPRIKNGHNQLEISCGRDDQEGKLRVVMPLVEARLALIPTTAGSDWRDLPNS